MQPYIREIIKGYKTQFLKKEKKKEHTIKRQIQYNFASR